MKIVLIHCPPWKIPNPNQSNELDPFGPPKATMRNKLAGDYLVMPYGLLSIAAQAKKYGHEVILINLSDFLWSDIETIITRIKDSVLFGMSCFTINRRGVAAMAKLIRRLHPQAKIVVGGPHATALPIEMLKHHQEIDSVVIGEGEVTFMEILQRLEKHETLSGVAGTAWREGEKVSTGAQRKRIDNIDTLSSPFDFYDPSTMLTSRGCPGKCSFCASSTIWGKRLSLHSPEYVIAAIEKAVIDNGEKVIAIKDDTFTANRKRILTICKWIIERKINFTWSCDTRVDYIDDEILFAMRNAGCVKISLGVESGSPEILKNINKNISHEKILKATSLAKKYGFQIRYYMMIGNIGETIKTFNESLLFIEKAKPNEFMFCPLAIYPGTEVFNYYCKKFNGNADIFFTSDSEEIFTFFGDHNDAATIMGWYENNVNNNHFYNYSIKERAEILTLFPELGSAHLDLGVAHLMNSDLQEAEKHLKNAIKLLYPLRGVAYNYLAIIAAFNKKHEMARKYLEEASKDYESYNVDENIKKIIQLSEHDLDAIKKFNLLPSTFYHHYEHFEQPVRPAPIDANTIQ